jgi:predicted nucleotidyltransferase
MDIHAIETYLRMVGHELDAQGLTCEIILLGGAVMLIEIGNRSSTQDVDTYFVKDFTAIMKAAAVVARREGLPDG